ncbi:unnamed protein product [Boreogadus saida]
MYEMARRLRLMARQGDQVPAVCTVYNHSNMKHGVWGGGAALEQEEALGDSVQIVPSQTLFLGGGLVESLVKLAAV